MRRSGDLEQTPSLIDADVTDHLRRIGAGVKRCRRLSVAFSNGDKLKTLVRSHTVGSSRPMLADTPVCRTELYWMLFTPVSVFWPPSRFDELLPGTPAGARRMPGGLAEGEPGELAR